MAETHKLRTWDILPKTQSFHQLNMQAEKLAKASPSASLPSLEHLRMADYDLVYEPSDDTYLMIDALNWDFSSANVSANVSANQGKEYVRMNADISDVSDMNGGGIRTTLEIGCGTGVNTIFLAKLLHAQHHHSHNTRTTAKSTADTADTADTAACTHIVTDINPHAIRITKLTAQHNQITATTSQLDSDPHTITNTNTHTNTHTHTSPIEYQYHQCDLATPLLQKYQNKINIIIFNPPYVPTPNEEVGTSDIEASWAGGTDGRIVIDQALPQIATLLHKTHGVAYMITVDDNKPEDIATFMKDKYRIRVEPYFRRRARNEFLTVLKMQYII